MPSQYSPNLRVELIANGEQSGTWGSTTNVNLGTILEQAISGYQSIITTGANQALIALDGASDEARNMVLDIDTTIGSAFNVFVPPSPKVYVVKNSASHDLTIYCSSVLGNTIPNGVGSVIPAGKTFFVFSTGIDVLPTITDIPFTLAVDSGGTGNTSFTDGQILIGNSAAGNTLTKTTLTGTANQVIVTNGGGSITLSLPQDVDTGADVEFNGITVTAATVLTGATSTPTAAEKNNTSTIASTAFVDRLRSLSTPTTSTTGGNAVIGDRGSLITLNSGGLTIPNGVFSARDVLSIYNNTATNLTITQGASLTLRLVGTATTGNRTLAQRGLATVVFISSSEAVISGGGVT